MNNDELLVSLQSAYENVKRFGQYIPMDDPNRVVLAGVANTITAAIKALSAPSATEHKERLIRIMGTFDLATGHADGWNDVFDSLESELRDVLGHYRARSTAPPTEETAIGHARYEYLRTLNPRQFAALYDEALADERFDDLVDCYRMKKEQP